MIYITPSVFAHFTINGIILLILFHNNVSTYTFSHFEVIDETFVFIVSFAFSVASPAPPSITFFFSVKYGPFESKCMPMDL